MSRRLALVAAATVASLGPTDAAANGRPPATNGVFLQPGAPGKLFVRSTFGLLVSEDDGCSFRWVCEQNIGYGGTFDPQYAIAADGTVFATTFAGLRVSRDGGCSFTTATEEIWVDALDLGPDGDVWIGTAETGRTNDVLRSTDNGATFVAQNLASDVVWYKSVAVAPSDAARVYVTGYEAGATPRAHMYASSDDGATWAERSLSGVTTGVTPIVRIAAIDAADPDRVFLVAVGANPPGGDQLYRSTDGGVTFTPALTTTQPIADVVVRDGGEVLVAAVRDGAFRSTDGGTAFAPIDASPQLSCLAERPDGSLIGCGANWMPDFLGVGRSTDAASWEKLFRFVELAGPLACPPGTVGHDVCDQEMWPALAQQFAVTGPTCGAAPDGPPDDGSSGCCEAGGDPPAGAMLVLVALGWITRCGARRARRCS